MTHFVDASVKLGHHLAGSQSLQPARAVEALRDEAVNKMLHRERGRGEGTVCTGHQMSNFVRFRIKTPT